MSAHADGRVRLVLPRYPDFYGPNVLNRLFAPIFDGAISGKSCRWPIDANLAHEFIFINDAAEAMIRLVETPMAHGVPVHVPGPGTIPGREFIELAYRAAGNPAKFSVFGRGAWRFAGLFDAEVKGAYEMAYLFETPIVLGGSRYDSLVGEARPQTPYPEGIRRTIEWFRSPSRGSRTENRRLGSAGSSFSPPGGLCVFTFSDDRPPPEGHGPLQGDEPARLGIRLLVEPRNSGRPSREPRGMRVDRRVPQREQAKRDEQRGHGEDERPEVEDQGRPVREEVHKKLPDYLP